MLDLANDPEHHLSLRRADQARPDCGEGATRPIADRAWLSRKLLLGFASVWALFAARDVAGVVISPAFTAFAPATGYGLPHPPVGPRQSAKG